MFTCYKYLLVFASVLLAIVAKAQNTSADIKAVSSKIGSAIAENYKRYPQEKLFIHTSQSNYTGGQTLWFKVYAMSYGKPSQLSNIVYVNLARLNGKIVSESKLPLKNGEAHGNINLPDTLSSGWYQMQAYTAWMLNFNDDGICRQKIYIQNLRDRPMEPTVKTIGDYHVSFLPEGGDLLDGMIGNIAFKAVDGNGAPVHITGEVLVNGRVTGTKFSGLHDGMGSFRLETYAADNYKVNIHFPDNTTRQLPLPEVKKQGIGLQISSGSEFISLALSSILPDQNVTVVAMQSNGSSANQPVKLNRGRNIMRFRKAEFATGIVRFTVFDEAGIPVAERLLFVNNGDQLKLSLLKDSLSFTAKAANAISFSVKDAEIKPRSVNLSVSVTDADLDRDPAENILSGMLLSSEIKGYVNNPAYYFQSAADTLQQQLDLVMLTNGWRHFKWEKILSVNPAPMRFAPEKKQFAAGIIEGYDPKKELKLKLIIINPDSSKHFVNVVPDSAGHFLIDDNGLTGRAQIYYDAVNNENKKTTAKIRFTGSVIDSLPILPDTTFFTESSQRSIPVAFLDSLQNQQRQAELKKVIELKQVNIRAARTRPVDQIIRDHVKNLKPDRVFDLDLVNERSLPSMSLIQYIIGRFPGLDIKLTNSGEYGYYYRGISTLANPVTSNSPNYVPPPPIFYLDEARVEDKDVENISMYDIALVRFAPPPVWFAPLGGGINGAILIYTKNYKDDGVGKLPGKGLDRYVVNGYTVQREFAEPDHTDPRSVTQPDYRCTLYWNPNVIPDSNGEVKIKFYNSDRARHYRVTVQGMAADGDLGYYSKVF